MEAFSGSTTVTEWARQLALVDRDAPDAERIDLLRALEDLKSAAAAAQARVASDFDTSQREQQAAAGEPASRLGRGVAEQVALARRESAFKGGRHLGVAKALAREMPHTLSALTLGLLSEWRATLLVRETAYLERAHRAVVDRELAGPAALAALVQMGDRELVAAAKKVAYRLDPHAATDRARRAASQRTVTLRPAPDTMSYLTALLPVAEGVACHAALTRAADAARATGDPRSKGQVMADALVAALAAQSEATRSATRPTTWAEADMNGRDGSSPASGSPGDSGSHASAVRGISLQLVMTDRSLLAGDDEPAHLVGYGSVPAGWARDLLRGSDAEVWVRRLYTHPTTGDLLAADARSRRFGRSLREVLVGRDQRCRTPWCDAPIRHADHVTQHRDGGPTSRANGQGLCEQCNHAKQGPGWRAGPEYESGTRHAVVTTTPTGHAYRSRAPDPPGHPVPGLASQAERHLAELVLAC